MTAITNVQGFKTQDCFSNYLPSQMRGEEKVLDDKVSRLSNELLMLKTVHSGFISTDKKAQLLEQGVSTKQLEAIEATRGRLLGGAAAAAGVLAGMAGMMGIDQAISAIGNESNGKKQRDTFNYNWIRETQDELDRNGVDAYCASYHLDDRKFDANFTGVLWERREIVAGHQFQLTIFKGGTLVNNGDGGYLNWGFTCPEGARKGGVVRWS